MIREIEKEFDGNEEHPVIKTTKSYVSGFDPDTKKRFKTCTTTYSYQVLLYDGESYQVGTREKTIFNNGIVHDWHWEKNIKENMKIIKILEKC